MFTDALLSEDQREAAALAVQEAAADAEQKEPLETAVRTRAGKLRDVRWQLAYAPSEDDDEIALFAFGQDTTDERALAARVRQSEKLAAVGTLAAGLAHEIRNPLNGAQLHVTFLERGLVRAGIDDADTVEAVRVVREEIRRLSNLVTEFLDFARPRPLVLKPISLRALCERTAALVASDAAALKADVRTDLPSADVTLEIDPGRMEQVLLNLLQNAIDAVGSGGGGAVVLRARRQPRAVLIEVEDEGPGLPSPDAPIFDPFFSTKPHGTGLGLAIVPRIVSDHGGTIAFQSRPGRTVFSATLPVQPADWGVRAASGVRT